jgi:hypothetical protein
MTAKASPLAALESSSTITTQATSTAGSSASSTCELETEKEPEPESMFNQFLKLTKRLAFGDSEESQQLPSTSVPITRIKGESGASSSSPFKTPNQPPRCAYMDAPLPPGWILRTDPVTERTFFANLFTKETTWIDPRAPAVVPVPLGLDDVDWNALPFGWERVINTAGDTFYIDHNERVTSWYSPRDLTQAEQVEELEKQSTVEHLHLKKLEGGLQALQRENLYKFNHIEQLKIYIEDAARMAIKTSDSTERAKLYGRKELLEEQHSDEVTEVKRREKATEIVIPKVTDHLERVRAVEQCAREFEVPLFGSPAFQRSKYLGRRQLVLAKKLSTMRTESIQMLGSLEHRWRDYRAAEGFPIAESRVVRPDEVDGSRTTSVEGLHIGADGMPRTDCAMKLMCLVIKYVLTQEIADVQRDIASMLLSLSVGSAEQAAAAVAKSERPSSPPPQLSALTALSAAISAFEDDIEEVANDGIEAPTSDEFDGVSNVLHGVDDFSAVADTRVRGSENYCRKMWLEATPIEGVITADQVFTQLRKRGLPEYVLKGIWKSSKNPGAPSDEMNETEFQKACKLVDSFKNRTVFAGEGKGSRSGCDGEKRSIVVNDMHTLYDRISRAATFPHSFAACVERLIGDSPKVPALMDAKIVVEILV